MMTSNRVVLEMATALRGAGVPYMIVGSYSNIIAMQSVSLDWEYIHRWCDTHGTRELLASVVAMVPKQTE